MTLSVGDRVVVVRMIEHGPSGAHVGRRGTIKQIAGVDRRQHWPISVLLDGSEIIDKIPMWFGTSELERLNVLDVLAEVSNAPG